MPAFPRDELERMWDQWLEANRRAEQDGDWTQMADCYAEDATYGWMYSPDDHFMAVGRDEIRDFALGTEMLGFDGWQYPYVARVMDEHTGMVVGFWRQFADIENPATGRPYEMVGIGGSWFGYGGDMQWAWQRDFFDVGSATATMLQMAKDGNVTDTMQQRFSVDPATAPGHYTLGDLPAGVWPPGVAD